MNCLWLLLLLCCCNNNGRDNECGGALAGGRGGNRGGNRPQARAFDMPPMPRAPFSPETECCEAAEECECDNNVQ